jgi:hypothetical protein
MVALPRHQLDRNWFAAQLLHFAGVPSALA